MKALLTIISALFCSAAAAEHSNDWIGKVALPATVILGCWGLLRAWRFLNFDDREW